MITELDEEGFNFLSAEEGLVLHPYRDSKGIPTIAIGCTFYPSGKKVTMDDPDITKEQAIDIFNGISGDFLNAVGNTSPNINQNQFNALFSLCWNIGVHGYLTSTARRLVSANPNDPAIGDAFRMWKKPIELLARREREIKLYFS